MHEFFISAPLKFFCVTVFVQYRGQMSSAVVKMVLLVLLFSDLEFSGRMQFEAGNVFRILDDLLGVLALFLKNINLF